MEAERYEHWISVSALKGVDFGIIQPEGAQVDVTFVITRFHPPGAFGGGEANFR